MFVLRKDAGLLVLDRSVLRELLPIVLRKIEWTRGCTLETCTGTSRSCAMLSRCWVIVSATFASHNSTEWMFSNASNDKSSEKLCRLLVNWFSAKAF